MKLKYAGQFKKDYKRVKKQNKDLGELNTVIEKLLQGKKLDSKYHVHPLHGKWSKHNECHIQPDWLLIYKINSNTLFLSRTGSHAELFK